MADAAIPRHRLTADLAGRDDEAAICASFLDECAARGGALLVTGEPGVGKTALLDAAADAATTTGARILRAAGVEFEADLSFAGLNQLLLPLVDDLPGLAGAHRDALTVALGLGDGPAADQLIIGTAALALLRRAASTRPLVLVVDDLPWIDRASALVFSFAARRLTGTRVAFLAAQRSEESFFARSGIRELELIPLDDETAAGLVRSRFPMLTPRVRRRLVAEARGNPLALLELPRELTTSQQTAHDTLPEILPLGRRLQTIFASRVVALPPATRRVLLLAALDGSGDLAITDIPTSTTAVDPEETCAVDHLGPAELARLVSVDAASRRLSFTHPLIRSAVVELSTSREQRVAHRLLAALPGTSSDNRARHLADAALGPDDDVATLLEQSAYRVLRRGDGVAAVATLLRAADLSPDGGERARRLAAAAYVGAEVTGALSDVTPLLAQARLADPALDDTLTSAVAAASLLLNGDGDVDTAHRLLVGALHTVDPGPGDRRVIDEALYTLMMVCAFGGRPELWEPFHAAVERFHDHISALIPIAAVTNADPARSTAAVLHELDAILAGLREETDPTRIVRVAIACAFVDRLGACRHALLEVIRDGRTGGAVASAVYALLILAFDAFQHGRWQESEQFAGEGIELCEKFGYPLMAWPGRYVGALLAAGRGERARFEKLYEVMPQWAVPRRALVVRTYLGHARGLAALGRGDFDDAYHQFAAISPPGSLAPHGPFALWTMMDLVEAAVHTGRYREAGLHVTAAQVAGIASISPLLALHCAGAAAMAAPDDETATELFEQALAPPDPSPFYRARVELAYGERLRHGRAMTSARHHLHAALEVFDGLDARPWAQRTRSELQATGQSQHNAEPAGTQALTPQEREIALLAAAGLTNRQIGERLFLSHRTVGAHLYRIFPKLGITSRSSLRDALNALPHGRTDL